MFGMGSFSLIAVLEEEELGGREAKRNNCRGQA